MDIQMTDQEKIERLYLCFDVPYNLSRLGVLTAKHIKIYFDKEGTIIKIRKPKTKNGAYKLDKNSII